MSTIKDKTDDELLLLSNKSEKDFNKKRSEAKRLMDLYYRQGYFSSYVDEERLLEAILACKESKQAFRSVRDELLRRENRAYSNSYSDIRDNISRDIQECIRLRDGESEAEFGDEF